MFSPIWITRDGRRINIGAMATSHITNCVRKIQRSQTGWRQEYLERLQLELEIRALKQ